MARKWVHQFLTRMMLAFMVAANLNMVSSGPASTFAQPAAAQGPYTLHGGIIQAQLFIQIVR